MQSQVRKDPYLWLVLSHYLCSMSMVHGQSHHNPIHLMSVPCKWSYPNMFEVSWQRARSLWNVPETIGLTLKSMDSFFAFLKIVSTTSPWLSSSSTRISRTTLNRIKNNVDAVRSTKTFLSSSRFAVRTERQKIMSKCLCCAATRKVHWLHNLCCLDFRWIVRVLGQTAVFPSINFHTAALKRKDLICHLGMDM